MSKTDRKIDSAELDAMLTQLRLPEFKEQWRSLADRSDREGWPAACLLSVLAEQELAGREQRRIARHLAESRLVPGKTLESFDFKVVPKLPKSQVMALSAGGAWIDSGDNLLIFGPPGVGKSHLASGIGRSLVDLGYRVLFHRTTEIVQSLQRARESLSLESAISKLDKYHLLILDDFSYGHRDREEGTVLFDLIGHRYESRSILITSNQPFGEWTGIFPNEAMTLAAVDRLVHHSKPLELNVESYRRREASGKTRKS